MKVSGIVANLCCIGMLLAAGFAVASEFKNNLDACHVKSQDSAEGDNSENTAILLQSLIAKVKELEAFRTHATCTFSKLVEQVQDLESNQEQLKKENLELIEEKEVKMKQLNNLFEERLQKCENMQTDQGIIVSKNQEEVNQWLWKLSARRTCFDLAKLGMTKSGTYYLDPDGSENNSPPIKVLCKFSEESNDSVSIISHNRENQANVSKCSDPHCDIIPIEYQASFEQITALIDQSETCKQIVTYNCYLTPLSRNGQDYAGWKDRNGVDHSFCGKGNQCTCDDFLPANLTDIFEIREKDKLPITSVSFGGLKVPAQNASYQISKLECTSGYKSTDGKEGGWSPQEKRGDWKHVDAAIIVGGSTSMSSSRIVELWSPTGICNKALKPLVQDFDATTTDFLNGEVITCGEWGSYNLWRW